MGMINKLINGKEAFQAVDMDDLFFPINEEKREQLQEVLYGMYGDILEISKEEGLTPFLIGGSALGAVRHKGFIPWDDDLDIGFMRAEYERFLTVFSERYSRKYVVNSPGKQERTRARFTKIMKKGTVFREMITLPEEDLNGIFIDVFPIDNVPDNTVQRKLRGIRCDLLAYISSQVFNRENRTAESIEAFRRTGVMNYKIRMAVGLFFGSFNRASWWFQTFDEAVQYKDNQSRYCTIAAGRRHYFGELLRRDMLLPARYMPFGVYSAPVFKDVEGYLAQTYGDYMRIPPLEKRERHYVKELKV